MNPKSYSVFCGLGGAGQYLTYSRTGATKGLAGLDEFGVLLLKFPASGKVIDTTVQRREPRIVRFWNVHV